MTSFDTLPIGVASRAALATMGVSVPTPIQEAAIPPLVAGRDVIGQARTGSGKTLAFVLPLLERLDSRIRDVQALILVPTRELAAQVASVIEGTANGRPVRTALIIGGVALGPQRRALQSGAQVVIGTPGRVLDHLKQGSLRLAGLRLLVLDEADEMLDRGFAPDVERIIAATPSRRQMALFSATVPAWVGQTAAGHLHDPVTVKVDTSSEPVAHVPHTVYDVPDGAKPAALRALLIDRGEERTLVFGRTKHGVRKLAVQLTKEGFPVAALQGNLSQNARDRVMAEFRSGAMPILVATNVAARGLDVEDVSRVINYELPESAALLTHRVGRTGRMGREGEAITLLCREDEPAWRKLMRELSRPPVRHPWPGGHIDTPAAIKTEAVRTREHVSGQAAPRPAATAIPGGAGERTGQFARPNRAGQDGRAGRMRRGDNTTIAGARVAPRRQASPEQRSAPAPMPEQHGPRRAPAVPFGGTARGTGAGFIAHPVPVAPAGSTATGGRRGHRPAAPALTHEPGRARAAGSDNRRADAVQQSARVNASARIATGAARPAESARFGAVAQSGAPAPATRARNRRRPRRPSDTANQPVGTLLGRLNHQPALGMPLPGSVPEPAL